MDDNLECLRIKFLIFVMFCVSIVCIVKKPGMPLTLAVYKVLL